MTLHPNEPLSSLANNARAKLKQLHGHENATVAAAPGRVNLIGEHIDYCDGFVLPLAIERYIVVAGGLNNTQEIRIQSEGQPEAIISLSEEMKISEPKWANYIRGVIAGFRKRGHTIPGFDAYFISSLPSGGGLSSSAALECATATLLEGLLDTTIATKEKALIAQKAEHDFAGVPCGIMDQFASTFGAKDQLILIDCKSQEPELIPFINPNLEILIANTCVAHDLSDGAYANRRKDTEEGLALIGKSSWRHVTLGDVEEAQDKMSEQVLRRSRHVVSEIVRTIAAADGLRRENYASLGQLMKGSHESLRDDFEVSCPELNLMVDIAESIGFEGGVLGSRMTGGGFGGSTVTLCQKNKAEQIATEMFERYQAETNITPEIFSTRPAQGAHLL